MRYRVALCGFSEFEYRAMHFSFLHPDTFSASSYDVVDALAEADFAVVDADSAPAVKGVVQSGRVAQSVFVGAIAPQGAASHLHRPIDPSRILRTLDDLIAQAAAGSVSRPMPHFGLERRAMPTLEDVVDVSEVAHLPDAPAPPASATAAAAPSADTTKETPEMRAALQRAAKAAARAAARRARLTDTLAQHGAGQPLRDVLVLDADTAASAALCELLQRFGFVAHPVRSADQVGQALQGEAFAALFLDISLDDAGVALLQHIRDVVPRADHPPPAVLLTSAQLDPTERVRAALAGIAPPLIKPLARGAVARALESVGVALPADARRL